MNRITILSNTAVMGVFGFASRASQIQVDNVLMYPDAYDGLAETFPLITVMALRVQWLCWGVPLIWLGSAAILVLLLRKMTLPRANSIVQLHTSITLLVGMILLMFFVVAGVLPFCEFVVGSG